MPTPRSTPSPFSAPRSATSTTHIATRASPSPPQPTRRPGARNDTVARRRLRSGMLQVLGAVRSTGVATVNQARFQKQQREKARREKAQAKAEGREAPRSARDESPETTAASVDQAEVVAELADLHARLEAGTIDYDDFVTAKDQIAQRLQI